MSLRINYNLASSVAQRSMNASQDTYARMAERLSTGLRINKSSDDAAGMAVSERLKNQVRGLNMAGRNAQDGVSLIQTAEGALAETHNILARLRELAVQAANDTLTATDRANLQTEANQLVSEIDRIAASTQFNGISLLDKNSYVSLHGGGDGLQLQIGANKNGTSNDNGLNLYLASARAQDLGDVKTVNAARASGTQVTALGANTVTIGSASGVKYNAEVDTVFDVRDAINAAGGDLTASVKNGKLRLESLTSATASASIGTDSGDLVSKLFATTSTSNTATGTTTLEDLGVTAGGTLSIATAAAAASGSTTLGALGVTAGTLTINAAVAAGTLNQAAGTATLKEIGVTEASGNLVMTLTGGVTVTTAYTNTQTLATLATNMQTALQTATSGTETVTFTAGTGFAIDLTAGSGTNTFSGAAFTAAVGGKLLTKIGLTATPASLATNATTALGAGVLTTAAQSEAVTVAYTTTDTLAGVATAIQTALPAAGAVGDSTSGTLAAVATADFGTTTTGKLTLDTGSAGVTIATITDSGTLKTKANLASAPASRTAASTAVVSGAATETVSVTFATTDTLSGLATNIQTALASAGAVGSSSIGTLASGTADFGTTTANRLTIDTGDADVTISGFSASGGGGLIAALNLSAPANSATAYKSSANIVQNKYRLESVALSGVTSISSGTGGILDIGTQSAASAAISTVDSAINQVSSVRAGLGAMQSRLESATRSIAIASENAAAANSRIADADIAQSMSDLVRAQILQQAGISVLAQANQAPSLVLQLLK